MSSLVFNTAKKYTYTVRRGCLGSIGDEIKLCSPAARNILTVSDEKVFSLYSESLIMPLKKSGYEVSSYILPNGEDGKDIANILYLLEFMNDKKLMRSDVVIALGGGSVSDSAGLAASLFKRGVKYIIVPTTLLSAVDASVGGKTAADLCGQKNLIGTFYQPDAVLCDPDVFKTLDDAQKKNGIAEMIKYAALFDADFFSELKKDEITDGQIIKCVSLKQKIVCEDEFDNGKRHLLNFGHTFGHAVERLSDFGVSHGRAVAIGMYLMAKCCDANGISSGCFEKMCDILNARGLNVECEYSIEDICSAALDDKKCEGDFISLVTLSDIGNGKITRIPKKELKDFVLKAF